MAIADLANPTRFLKFANHTIPWLSGLTVLVFAYGIDQAMLAPDDYQQGATVKIMFLHVPSAWLGMLGWGVMSVAALGTLVWRPPLPGGGAKEAGARGRRQPAARGCGGIRSPMSRRKRQRRSAWRSPCCVSSPARCGAGPNGVPTGSGTRG